tara:strand:- start:50 stop:604 length:555 start_codon:yes stop_codon:yes gene_type:complete
MKIKLLITALLLGSVTAHASITMSGAAILNTNVNDYTTGVFVASNTVSFDTSIVEDLVAGITLTAGSDLEGYTILGTGSVTFAGGPSVVLAGVTYDLGGSVATGNEIGVLVFENSAEVTVAGDAYQIYTDSWTVPADGVNASLTGAGPYTGNPIATSAVVPEPSAYALLGGLFALTCVMVRRRA